jgi:hypothetical protein
MRFKKEHRRRPVDTRLPQKDKRRSRQSAKKQRKKRKAEQKLKRSSGRLFILMWKTIGKKVKIS